MPRFEIFPKRQSSLDQSTNNDDKTANTSTLQNSILPCYSTGNSNPNDYPLNSQSVTKMRILSISILKQNTLLLRHLFTTGHFDFLLLEL